MSDPKSFVSHDAEGDNVTKDFWIAHFGHATEYNQLDEERRYHGFGGFVPSLQASTRTTRRSSARRGRIGCTRGWARAGIIDLLLRLFRPLICSSRRP